MTHNFSFYTNPLEDKYIPTEEEMEQERLREIEWEKFQVEQYYQKLYNEEMKEQLQT